MSRLSSLPVIALLSLAGLLMVLSPATTWAQGPAPGEGQGTDGPGEAPPEPDAPAEEPPAAAPASAAPATAGASVPGSVPGAAPGSVPGATPGSVTGATPGSAAGAAPGAPTSSGAGAAGGDPGCPTGNLLAGRKPLTQRGISDAVRITDGIAPNEGGDWRTDRTSVFADDKASITYDLGAVVLVRSLALQGDNNDTYEVSASVDGKVWHPLWTVPMHPTQGMRTRVEQGLDAHIRYLRIGGAQGDNAFSVGEFMAYCAHPDVWPPTVTRVDGKASKAPVDQRALRMTQGKSALVFFGALAFLGLFLYARRRDPVVLLLAPAAGGAALLYAGWMTRREVLLNPAKATTHIWEGRALIIAGILVGGLALAIVLRWMAKKSITRLAERGALASLVLASALSWINFGTFHGSRIIHYWDTFHYYMGSKYFTELGYTQLYHCSGVGEIDDGLRPEFEKRQLRDLRDNKLGKALPALDDDRGCRAAFTPERWAAFRQDLRLFRSFMGAAWWAKMFKDHGYNATPVWNLVGATLTNSDWGELVPEVGRSTAPNDLKGLSLATRAEIRKHFNDVERPAFERRIGRVVAIDFLLYAGIFLLIGWAFGLRACALAMVVWGSGYPWSYFWTGGAFGRVPWLFTAVAGMCMLRKGYTVFGGFGLTWSALLRGFPAGLVVGVSLQIAWRFLATLLGGKRPALAADGVPTTDRATGKAAFLARLPIGRTHLKFIAGCVLAVGILIPGSVPVAGSWDAWPEFLSNTSKHKATPLTNHMGLPTLLSYHPDRISKVTKNDKLEDPFALWKVGRQKTLQSRKLLHYGLLAAFALLIAYAGRRLKDWEVTALSGIFIIGVFELTCYYYNFVVMLAPFVLRRWRYIFVYLAMSLSTQVIKEKWTWYDEQYTWETLAVLATYVYFLVDSAWRLRKGLPDDAEAWLTAEEVEKLPPLEPAPASPAPPSSAPPSSAPPSSAPAAPPGAPPASPA